MILTSNMEMKTFVLSLLFAIGIPSNDAVRLPLNANCSVGGILPNTRCSLGLQCELYDEGNIPADLPAKGICKIPNDDTCFDQKKGLYFSPNTTFSGDCGSCVCSAQGGEIECSICVPAGGTCFVGGFIRTPQLPCQSGYQCVLSRAAALPDVASVGICKKPNANTCFDKGRTLYLDPNVTLKLTDCGPCTCAPQGGQLMCASCVRAGGSCMIGGFIATPPLPCQTGYTCILNNQSTIPDIGANGICAKPNGNTCYDSTTRLYFAANATVPFTDCGPCKCPATGGPLECATCLRAGGACSVGGFIATPPLPCQSGLSCVLNRVPRLPDVASTGLCRKPNRDTCFESDRQIYLAPNATLPLSDCGPCKCAAKGGELECQLCILDGGKCTIGGRFVGGPALGCEEGRQCVLYDEGLIAADIPALGNCKTPDNDTCYEGVRELYFAPKAKLSNNCGPCRCSSHGGIINCKIPVVNCPEDPCLDKTCPSSPEATCEASFCGSCDYTFFLDGVEVTC